MRTTCSRESGCTTRPRLRHRRTTWSCSQPSCSLDPPRPSPCRPCLAAGLWPQPARGRQWNGWGGQPASVLKLPVLAGGKGGSSADHGAAADLGFGVRREEEGGVDGDWGGGSVLCLFFFFGGHAGKRKRRRGLSSPLDCSGYSPRCTSSLLFHRFDPHASTVDARFCHLQCLIRVVIANRALKQLTFIYSSIDGN
jgi:hypothetical protein